MDLQALLQRIQEDNAARCTPEYVAQQRATWAQLGTLAERYAVETDPNRASRLAQEIARHGGSLSTGGQHQMLPRPTLPTGRGQLPPEETPRYEDTPLDGPKFL